MKKQIISFSLVVAGFFLGATALSAFAQTWSPPGTGYPAGTNCTPPNCNVPAPINVGSSWQYKMGPVSFGTSTELTTNIPALDVIGGALFDNLGITGNLIVASGSPQIGDVLTAQDTNGTVGWGTVATGGSSAVNNTSLLALAIPLIPITIVDDSTYHTITQVTLSAAGVPASANTVILSVTCSNMSMSFRSYSGSPFSLTCPAGTTQVNVPLSSSGTFDYGNVYHTSGAGFPTTGVQLIGYATWPTNIVALSTPIQVVPIQYSNDSTYHTITQATLSAAGVPSSARAVFLYATGGNKYMTVRASSNQTSYIMVAGMGSANLNGVYGGGQLLLPLSSSGTFDWGNTVTFNNGGQPNIGLEVIGYAL